MFGALESACLISGGVVWAVNALSRELSAQQELVDEPNDTIYLNEDRQLAEQVVRLSFDYARVQAQLLGSQASADNPAGQTVNPQYQNLADLLAKANQRVIGLQNELGSYKQQLETAAGRKRKIVESEIAETQSEIELAQARIAEETLEASVLKDEH